MVSCFMLRRANRSHGLVMLTSFDAVRLRLPLALEFMTTRGQLLLRRRGVKACVMSAVEVMVLLKILFELSRRSDNS